MSLKWPFRLNMDLWSKGYDSRFMGEAKPSCEHRAAGWHDADLWLASPEGRAFQALGKAELAYIGRNLTSPE